MQSVSGAAPRSVLNARAVVLGALIWLGVCGPAAPGAWPREKGTWFASANVTLGWPQDMMTQPMTVAPWPPPSRYSTLYLEYGLSERWTLGLDLGRAADGGGKTIAFLQYPIWQADRGLQATAQLGFGRINDAPVLRPGASLGLGLAQGWLSIDGFAEVALESGATDLKLDITWGRNLENGRKLVLQVQSGAPADADPYVRLAPSYVFPLSDRVQIETGVTWGLEGDRQMGLKLGVWTQF